MENQDIGLGSILPWTVQESCGSPTLPSVEPCLPSDNHMGGFEVNAWSQPSQLSSAMYASNHVHAATPLPYPEQFKLIDEKFHAHSTVMGDFSAGIKEKTALFEKHNFVASNSGIGEGFKQVQMHDGLGLQSSEACHKRFIIFDQTGSRARVIFHPALVYEFPNVLPTSAKVLDNTKGLDNIVGEKETIQEVLSACDSTDWGARLFAYRESMVSAYPALAKIRRTGLDPMTLGEGFCGFSTGEETESHMSCNGSSQGYSQFHEDSRDIEALLNSDYDDDDEASTGHTPSEVIITNELTYVEDSADVSNCVPRKRRRCGDLECRDEEVDFTPTAIEEKAPVILKCTSASACLRPSGSHELKIQPDCNFNARGSERVDDQFCDSASSNSVARKASSESSATKQRGSCNSKVRRPSSSKKSRIEKMKRTLDLLRGVIPAGDCMDTAVVLDVATCYLKSLQLQAKGQGSSPGVCGGGCLSHGVCLATPFHDRQGNGCLKVPLV